MKNFINIPNLRTPIKVGTRIHFLRDGEVSEGSVVVSEVVGNTILFDDPIPVDIREGDELISINRKFIRLAI